MGAGSKRYHLRLLEEIWHSMYGLNKLLQSFNSIVSFRLFLLLPQHRRQVLLCCVGNALGLFTPPFHSRNSWTVREVLLYAGMGCTTCSLDQRQVQEPTTTERILIVRIAEVGIVWLTASSFLMENVDFSREVLSLLRIWDDWEDCSSGAFFEVGGRMNCTASLLDHARTMMVGADKKKISSACPTT